DFAGEVHKIEAPTLLVWGGRDALCSRRDHDVLLSAIAQARLVVYENAGHAAHWEEPDRFATDLVAFIES
ncbi:MAG TPA: alpha/beta hydrolase, partial [Dehalococcoidia bacterium]|nr:alpha/beta hydrolase [Dehalococcoidia bacterium]